MNKLRVIVFVAMTIFMSSGCSMTVHQDFSFTSPKVLLANGAIHAKLRGKMDETDEKTVTHGPYELLLWVSIDAPIDAKDCKVEFASVKLKNIESGGLVHIPSSFVATFRKSSSGEYVASINSKGLDLEYSDHKLEFKYMIDGACNLEKVSAKTTMLFQKDFSERKISFWDTLMGI